MHMQNKEIIKNIPNKCLNCEFVGQGDKLFFYCKAKRKEISELSAEIIENCNLMNCLLLQRKEWINSCWSDINKHLFENILILNKDNEDVNFFLTNFDDVTKYFKVYEILSYLHSITLFPMYDYIYLITTEDIISIVDKVVEFEDLLENNHLLSLNIKEEINGEYDLSSVIMLDSILSTNCENENTEIFRNFLKDIKKHDDFKTIIELSKEYGMISADFSGEKVLKLIPKKIDL